MTADAFPPELRAFADEVGPEGPVAVVGGRTAWDRGGPVAEGTRLLPAPAGVVRHSPEDMTVRVRAGTTVRELHDRLAGAGQRTALPERGGTVGGALAVGDDALAAPGLGTVRAALLECTLVTSEGRLARGGGPTVKNVSGYDVPRLVVGSLGTLALVAEVLLRTSPTPEVARWFRGDDLDVAALRAGAVHRPAALATDGVRTWVLLEGHAADVDDQRRRLDRCGTFEACDDGPRVPTWRWSLPRAEVRAWVEGGGGDGLACLVTGRLWRDVRQPDVPVDPTVRRLHDRLRDGFDPHGRLNPGRDVLRD